MGNSLSIEKLERRNYASYAYKMHQYLLGHEYWSYVEGANEVPPEPILVLLCLMCLRLDARVHKGCEVADACLGEPKEDLRRQHHTS